MSITQTRLFTPEQITAIEAWAAAEQARARYAASHEWMPLELNLPQQQHNQAVREAEHALIVAGGGEAEAEVLKLWYRAAGHSLTSIRRTLQRPSGDTEADHSDADERLCMVILLLAAEHPDPQMLIGLLVDYLQVPKWYA